MPGILPSEMACLFPQLAKLPHIPNPFSSVFIAPRFYCMGFGFDPRTSDYNIVVIPLRAFPENHPEYLRSHGLENVIYMYSHNNKTWKQVHSRVEDFIYDQDDHGISLGGSIYWLARNRGLEQRKKIVSFNIGEECFRDIALPKYEADAPNEDFSSPATFYIQVVEESIHLAIIPQERLHCHIWMLKPSPGTSVGPWTKKNLVVLPEAFWFDFPKNSWVSGLTLDGLLWVSSYDGHDIAEGPKHTDNYLLYNPKSGSLINSRRSAHWFRCICLTESLVGLPHRDMRPEVGCGDNYSFGDPKHMLNI